MAENTSDIFAKLASEGFVVFAGNGVTAAAGIPSWQHLLRGLQGTIGREVYPFEIKEEDADEFPEVAQRLYDKFVEVNGDPVKGDEAYMAAVRASLETTDWDYGAAQLSIVNVCEKIVTTNYDSTFRDAISDYYRFRNEKEPEFDVQALPSLDYPRMVQSKRSLVHVHGRTASAIILKEADYEKYYRSNGRGAGFSKTLRDFYKMLYQGTHIVFIGFSFRDTYIKGLLKIIYDELVADQEVNRQFDPACESRIERIEHYAFMSDEYEGRRRSIAEKYWAGSEEYKEAMNKTQREEEEFNELCRELGNIRITVLRYHRPKEYRQWLNEIQDEKRRAERGPVSAVSTWRPSDG